MKLDYLNDPIKFFESSLNLALCEFKSRNTTLYSGIYWQLASSVVLAAVLWLVFSSRFSGNIPDYPAYLLTGVIAFNFFQRVMAETTYKFIEWGAVIKSMDFSYQILIFSVVLEYLFSHLAEFMILTLLLIFVLKISPIGLLLYPLVLLSFIVFIYSSGMILATLTALKLDIGHLWRFISPLLLFITPIFHSSSEQSAIRIINLFNPLYYFISLMRETVIYGRPSPEMLAGAVIFSLSFFVASILLLDKYRYRLVENL